MPRNPPLTTAELDWRDGAPRCRRHDDIYYSAEGGLAESRHVFLRGNDLPARWRGRDRFAIAETGFGSGLNFLCALHCWLDTAPAGARLDYVAVEKYPLTAADLARALAGFPSLAAPAAALLAQYPPACPGPHRLEFAAGRVTLMLLLGDAATMLADLDAAVDAWFLDGFAPAKNPAMWSAPLFAEMARLSRDGATLATFTAAGRVRRALRTAGFAVALERGFGRKRDMLRGRFAGAAGARDPAPWFGYPAPVAAAGTAVVIGAGIAGCSAAEALARGGREVLLIERGPAVAAAASGNPGAVIMPRLGAAMTPDTAFHLAAFVYTVGWLARLAAHHADLPWHPVGVLHRLAAERAARLLALRLPATLVERLDPARAAAIAGLPIGGDALHYPGGGWLRPVGLCRALAAADGVELRLGQAVDGLRRAGERWRVESGGRCVAEASIVVVANGAAAAELLGAADLPMAAVRGQLAEIRATPASRRLRVPLCGEGYLLPARDGRHTAGATYAAGDTARHPRAADEGEILRRASALLPALENPAALGGRVAERAATPDYLPLAGPLPDFDDFRARYADLHHGRPAAADAAARYRPGLFVSAGHGSRGMVTAPLAAALIAACVDGQPRPRGLCAAAHPARFALRALRRGR